LTWSVCDAGPVGEPEEEEEQGLGEPEEEQEKELQRAGLTWSVRDAGPVREPDSSANTAQLHQQEPGHQNQEFKLATHGIHVHHQHLERYLACTAQQYQE